jgi:succinyl-CoA synthetase beta subunit
MNIHEYQAKDLLKGYGIPVPPGEVVHTVKAAARVAEEIGGQRWVVKAQIHAGGRGKAGGVRLANSTEELCRLTDTMLGSRLATSQTGSAGQLVQRILIERACRIERELYIGLVVDRATQRVVVIASSEGGVDIERVAEERPERIHKEVVDPATGLLEFQCRKIATAIGLQARMSPFVRILKALHRCFRDKDALLAEINPLVVTDDGDLLALDCKMTFDDNSLFRQGGIAELRDFDEEDPKEVEATSHGLNYIALDGQVGCIVNGAGLAMATMDAVVLHGGRPANFLDVGGGATPDKVANAFRIVRRDPSVRAIFVNIFAGINRCDWVARGVVQAMLEQDVDVPVVVRLAGTNVEEGRDILAASGLELLVVDDLDAGAARAVEAIREDVPA